MKNWNEIIFSGLSEVEKAIDAGKNVNERDSSGTALENAARNDQIMSVNYLIEEGADVKATDSNGYTPLHIAAHASHSQIIKTLLSAGADVNALSNGNETPLFMYAQEYVKRENEEDILEILLEANANLDIPSRHGFTPLHVAISYGNFDIAIKLISKGANVNTVNCYGDTPLHDAIKVWSYHSDITRALVAANRNLINIANKDNKTPIDIAKQVCRTNAVDFLEQNKQAQPALLVPALSNIFAQTAGQSSANAQPANSSSEKLSNPSLN